jgi:PLD-like domain
MQRTNLHSILERHAFDHSVICTFTFEPQFFEGYCLERFRSLAENKNITIILDRWTYEKIIHAPASEWPRLANLRYLLHPIAVPGTFHPKLFLFANRDKGLLVIGSANFTKPGLTSNAELVGVYRYERGKHERYLVLFRQAMQFLLDVAKRWASSDLESNLRDVLHDAEWLAPVSGETSSPLRLIHNLDRPLWEQICEGLRTPVDEVHVLSRYFDAERSILTLIIEGVKTKRVVLWTENGITTMTAAWFDHPAVLKCVLPRFL